MTEVEMEKRRPAEVFHVGEHLQDELDARGWTQAEFAEIIHRPYRLVNEIINGKRGITPETAREFGAALGTSAEFWMNLDTAYNLWKTNQDVSSIEHRALMHSKYPIREMKLRNWLEQSEDDQIIEGQTLRFFEIKSLEEKPKYALFAAPKRSGSEIEELTPIQIAWLYRVKHIAETINVSKYSREKLLDVLSEMEAFRCEPEKIRLIPSIISTCGVRFVIVEPLASSKIDGICLWLDENSPVIGMTLRYDRIDNFWFVLRHEIEHVLNGDGKEATILDSDIFNNLKDEALTPREKKANTAAAEFCVPQKDLDNFIARKDMHISRNDLLQFAKSIGVHPGLVVGQLQWKTNRYDLFRALLISIRDFILPVAVTDGYGYYIPI